MCGVPCGAAIYVRPPAYGCREKEICIMPVYPITVAGLHRELPICKITDELYIGAFICFGDAELTVACARDMLGLLDKGSYDYLFTAEAKSIPPDP